MSVGNDSAGSGWFAMSELATDDPVRLRAEDVEDLAVMAALLQDARITLREMVFDPEQNTFLAAFTRYRRELLADPTCCEGLTECGSVLRLGCIASVKHKKLDPTDLGRELSLLTIATAPGDRHLFHIELVFDEGVQIQLRTDCIDALLEDFGAARRSLKTPCDHFAEEFGLVGRA
jgi:hypothetical protein